MLDHINLADQVGDGHVGRGQLLLIARVAADPVDRGRVAQAGDLLASLLGEGRIRVVVDLGPFDHRQGVVEEVDELAEHPGLGLAPEPEEEHVVAGKDGVLDLGNDRLFVAQDVGEQWLAGLDLQDEVAAHLVLDRLALVAAGLQLAEGPGSLRRHIDAISRWEGDAARSADGPRRPGTRGSARLSRLC